MNNYTSNDPTAMMQGLGAMMLPILLIGLAFCVFMIYCQWRVFSKAGYPGALALLNLLVIIPFIGALIVLGLQIWFAFAEWPVQRQAKAAAPQAMS